MWIEEDWLTAIYVTKVFLFLYIDKRQPLMKTLDKLVKMELTREEVLERAEAEVDSTCEATPSPQKPKVKKAKMKKPPTVKYTKIHAAKQRAKELLQFKPYNISVSSDSESDCDGSKVAELQRELAQLRKKLETRSHSESGKQMHAPHSNLLLKPLKFG